MISIEPFDYSDEQYRLAIAINAAVFDAYADSMNEWKHDDETHDTRYPFLREMVWRDGVAIAYVESGQSRFAFHPQKYECRMFVHPAHDDGVIRPKVLQHTLNRLKDKELIALTSGMLDDKPHALTFFAEHGFETVAEEKMSSLLLAEFDADKHKEIVDAVESRGIEIVTLRQLQTRDADWQRKLYEMTIAVNQDIPSQGEKHYEPFEEWCVKRLSGPSYDPDAWFIALDGADYIGYSNGYFVGEAETQMFEIGATAVRREYRRRGIATALKVHITSYVQAQGVVEIFTSNDSKNPMYQLNLMLGFRPKPSWVRVEKSLKE